MIHETLEINLINTAYDKRNLRYIAYTINGNVFGVGICVQSAIDDYIAKSLEYITESERKHYVV